MMLVKLLLPLLLPVFLLSCQKESAQNAPEQSYLEIRSQISKELYFSETILCKGACARDLNKVSLEPVPDMSPCTMLYGGPEEIFVRGKVGDKEINAQFNRSGGCEIDRFDSVAFFLEKQGITRKELFPQAPRPPKIKEGSLP